MEEEIFGPVLTIYLYEPSDWEKTMDLVDETSPYALTGCVMGTNKSAIEKAKSSIMSEDKEFSRTSETSSKFLGLKNKVFLKKLLILFNKDGESSLLFSWLLFI